MQCKENWHTCGDFGDHCEICYFIEDIMTNQKVPYRSPLTVLLHTPKTGGSTIVLHVARCLESGEVLRADSWFHGGRLPAHILLSLSQEEKDRLRVVSGHFLPLQNIPNIFAGRPIKIMTFFREPADRIISMYNFFRKRYELKGLYFVHSDILSENGEVRPFLDWFWIRRKNVDMNYIGYILHNCLDYRRKNMFCATKAHFLEAKRALNAFDFVGITEQPGDFLVCCSLMGLSTSNVRKENVTMRSYVDLSESEMEEIRGHIRSALPYSQELYEYAKELNKKQKKALETKPAKSLTFA